MKKKYILIPIVVVIAAAAGWFWSQAQNEATYYGLPVVSCIDPTKPIAQDFVFTIQISINSENIPLSASIGHDPGKCLREIHAEDASGKVTVQSNSATETFSLREFFNVWHEQFTSTELMGNVIGGGHAVAVYVNGAEVATRADTPIHPNDAIRIVYR